jgi:hypothetical protein
MQKKLTIILMYINRMEGKNHNIKTDNRSFNIVAKFIYLGLAITNQILIHKELKEQVEFDNTCYHSVQNLLSSHLLSKNKN